MTIEWFTLCKLVVLPDLLQLPSWDPYTAACVNIQGIPNYSYLTCSERQSLALNQRIVVDGLRMNNSSEGGGGHHDCLAAKNLK